MLAAKAAIAELVRSPLPNVSPHWTMRQVEMVARARRVIGYGGAFRPTRRCCGNSRMPNLRGGLCSASQAKGP
jgi:hypothetical protein